MMAATGRPKEQQPRPCVPSSAVTRTHTGSQRGSQRRRCRLYSGKRDSGLATSASSLQAGRWGASAGAAAGGRRRSTSTFAMRMVCLPCG